MTLVKSKKMSMLRFLPERPHSWPNTDHYINFFLCGSTKEKNTHLLMDGKGSSSRNVTGNTKLKKEEDPI